jgi:benzylsuccinate CoA-transferase BbsF subunit
VTKIESAFGMDFFRGMGIDVADDPNQSPMFNQANLGVQSCCVNAGMEEGRAVLRSLIARADIVMHNMRGNHAGKQALASVLAALVRRDRTGEGCFLECAQFEVCLWAIGDKFLQHQVLPGTVGPLGNRSLDYVPHGCFPCAGPEQWCAVAAGGDEEWARLAGLLGHDELSDPELRSLAARQIRIEEIEAALAGWTSTRSPAEAVAALRAAGVSASIVVDGRSQAHDREMHESGFYVAVPHPRAGLRHYTGLPFYIDGARVEVRRAPLIGEYTEHVMLDVLHLLPGELSHLVETQAVGT